MYIYIYIYIVYIHISIFARISCRFLYCSSSPFSYVYVSLAGDTTGEPITRLGVYFARAGTIRYFDLADCIRPEISQVISYVRLYCSIL